MGLSTFFGFSSSSSTSSQLPEIYPFAYNQVAFVKTDITTIYKRILSDVLERTQGVPEKSAHLLWDSCVANEGSEGLVSMLADAMYGMSELCLVYAKNVNVLRRATGVEEQEIKADYKLYRKSSKGFLISFQKFELTTMLRIYSELEYCTIASLTKTMNLAQAIQLKISDLRASVSLADSDEAKAQALKIANALADGLDVFMDAKDSIETSKPDLTATKETKEFIDERRSFYLGLPYQYVSGKNSGGLSDTGNADAKGVDRGLKGFFFPIIKPTIETIFGVKASYNSDDMQQIMSSLEALKTFDITSGEFISADNKRLIVNKLFGFPETEKGDEVVEPKPDAAQPGKVPPKEVV